MTKTSVDKIQSELPDLLGGMVFQASIAFYWHFNGRIMAKIGEDGDSFPIGTVEDGRFIPVDDVTRRIRKEEV